MLPLPSLLALTLAALASCAAGPVAPPSASNPPSASGTGPAGVVVERQLYAMGTSLGVTVRAVDRTVGLAASEAAVRALAAVEGRLSTWRDDTDLARLNAAPVGVPVELEPATCAELERALAHSAEFDGAFDPTVGALVEAWDLRGAGRVPSAAECALALAATGAAGLSPTPGGFTKLQAGLRVEEGGWGKGAGLDAALHALAQAGVEGELDLGGQRASTPGFGARWIPLAHPQQRDLPVLEVLLDAASLAASGNSERGWSSGGRAIGHLLDPRNGQPAADFGALYVLAPTAFEADVLSTALFVLGPDAAHEYADAHPDVEVITLRCEGSPQGAGPLRDLHVQASAGLTDRVRPLDAPLGVTLTCNEL